MMDRKSACFTAKSLIKVYVTGESEVHALRGVSIEIPSGEELVMLRPLDSGKSTFLNIIGDLDKPSTRQVFLHKQANEAK